MTAHAVAFALALAAACGPKREPPVEHEPAAEPAAELRPSEAVTIEPLVRDLASGKASFVDHIDSETGVVFYQYFTDPTEQDPRADESGLVAVAERLCSAALADRLAALKRNLAAKLADGAEPECSQKSCMLGADAEYELGATLVFEIEGKDRAVLAAVAEVEGGPVTDEFRQQANDWLAHEEAKQFGGRCAK